MIKNKLLHLFRTTPTFLYSIFHERKFKCDSFKISYIFKRMKKSTSLVIVFPAVSKKPFFNYVKTMKKRKTNVLFIKDNFGQFRNGSYLFGNGGSLEIYMAIDLLVRHNITLVITFLITEAKKCCKVLWANHLQSQPKNWIIYVTRLLLIPKRIFVCIF